MTDNLLLDKFCQFVGQTSPYPPILLVSHAKGNEIFDINGKAYLDFISGVAVTNVGHCHPRMVDAVVKQVQSYAHTMVYGEHVQAPQVELAEAMVSVLPPGLDSVYFLTTGSEANDAALKLAVKKTGRSRFIAFRRAYHGDTVGALSCFGSSEMRHQFPGLAADVEFLPFGDAEALTRIDETVAGVLVEPVQGEAGIRTPPADFLKRLRQVCTSSGAVLIFDEVQTGFGRTGEWFAANTYDVVPDVMTLAKGMGGGYPLAAVVAPRQVMFDFAATPAFSHITTFGGHPVSCAAGLACFQIIRDEALLQNCREQGAWLVHSLKELAERLPESIVDVRGVGLMIGIELASEAMARLAVEAARDRGLILETTLLDPPTIRFSPALNISGAECERGMRLFEEVLQSIRATS